MNQRKPDPEAYVLAGTLLLTVLIALSSGGCKLKEVDAETNLPANEIVINSEEDEAEVPDEPTQSCAAEALFAEHGTTNYPFDQATNIGFAQSFSVSTPVVLSSLEVMMKVASIGNPKAGIVTAALYEGGAAPEAGTPLGVSSTNLPMTMQWARFAFPNHPALKPGITYYLVVRPETIGQWISYFKATYDSDPIGSLWLPNAGWRTYADDTFITIRKCL